MLHASLAQLGDLRALRVCCLLGSFPLGVLVFWIIVYLVKYKISPKREQRGFEVMPPKPNAPPPETNPPRQ